MKTPQLETYLEDDLAWRKKEISSLILIAENNDNPVLLKSVILLLYAHWEGYVKKSSKTYLKYIAELKSSVGELTENFKAVALKSIIFQCIENSESLSLHNELTIMNKMGNLDNMRFKLDIDVDNDLQKCVIDTKHNLSPRIFKNIISIIGLNYKPEFESKEGHINKHLLANRNLIGHGGRYQDKEEDEFILNIREIKKLRDIVFIIIDNLKDEIIEYASKQYYLSSKKNECDEFLKKQSVEISMLLSKIDETYK
ncbi:MAE_28990/MAE_18760 family HEPN-like nuclease [Cedecea davisae]|uniref:MAE_28990/MAE_18760 family HEPN-like nuclease n=1 Tax=Cedecea davisae TaxID=158484 RepID=UPI00376F01B2